MAIICKYTKEAQDLNGHYFLDTDFPPFSQTHRASTLLFVTLLTFCFKSRRSGKAANRVRISVQIEKLVRAKQDLRVGCQGGGTGAAEIPGGVGEEKV
jgi:hypothetical protein